MNRPLPDEFAFAKISDAHFEKKVSLVELLMFPLKSRHPNHFERIDWTLFNIWKNICRDHMIDHEYRYIYFDHQHSYDNQEPWEDEIDEVNRAFDNANTWIIQAKQEMELLCNTLYAKIADRDTYPKHYPRFKETTDKMRKRSQASDAILLPEYTLQIQDIVFTRLVEQFMPVILQNKDSLFIIERDKLTGFSEGKDCSKLICKINATSNVVHFHPAHDAELFKYQKTYDNPVISDSRFEIDEFDSNVHFLKSKVDNTTRINDEELLKIEINK